MCLFETLQDSESASIEGPAYVGLLRKVVDDTCQCDNFSASSVPSAFSLPAIVPSLAQSVPSLHNAGRLSPTFSEGFRQPVRRTRTISGHVIQPLPPRSVTPVLRSAAFNPPSKQRLVYRLALFVLCSLIWQLTIRFTNWPSFVYRRRGGGEGACRLIVEWPGNDLPEALTSAESLATFHHLLKAHLFRKFFPDYLLNINWLSPVDSAVSSSSAT